MKKARASLYTSAIIILYPHTRMHVRLSFSAKNGVASLIQWEKVHRYASRARSRLLFIDLHSYEKGRKKSRRKAIAHSVHKRGRACLRGRCKKGQCKTMNFEKAKKARPSSLLLLLLRTRTHTAPLLHRNSSAVKHIRGT